jgi:hypothetical protein
MTVDGPAAGHARMWTSADPSGSNVLGTLNNCAGGVTPWDTYLTAEENFHGYFWSNLCAEGGKAPDGLGGAQAKSYERYGMPGLWQAWGKFVDRFNVDKEPNEPNRFGWIIEIDPFDPACAGPLRRSVGRFCRRVVQPGDFRQRLVRLPRQCRGRCARAPVDLDRPG